MNGLTKPFAQSLLLTLVFAACLCLLGPVGALQEDPFSRWLLTHSALGNGGLQGLSGAATLPDRAGLHPFLVTLVEWTVALLAGGLAVAAMSRLPPPTALMACGLFAILTVSLPFLFFLATGTLVATSVPLFALAFGILCAWTLLPPHGIRRGAPHAGNANPVRSGAGAAVLSNPPPQTAAALQSPSIDDAPPHGFSSINGSPSGPTDPAPASSQAVGRYEIIRPIGKGAMGEVLLGRDPHINRLTAIKTVHFAEAFADEDIAQIKTKFFREAESAGALSHPHIVTIYDAGEDGASAYIAMEFLEGSTLLRFARRKHLLPLRRLIRYMIQVAEALDYAHTQGVVHRDIKPANIILATTGHIKITDFGIAHIATSSQTKTGVVKGTPYYMSPEQFSGRKVDGRSDLFSLGTTLFQLLTGTLPFYAESPALLMNQIMNFPHPNPRAINPRVIPAMVAIVDKALQKDRRNRYQSAGELAGALRRLDKRIKAALAARG